ncbi:putative repeat protein (TIGR01451 family)/predicted secreted protein (Por secretion system target) [Mangrovibacterium marinum]|uniref:Putative repeat protein (TIGR01451 family)/predicted secreted protein (Por secretion system target) n=1 Tax=Mangrovibacterium marinum TaxID=1639118 RepID=A0A2T5BX91_9BACT|nr:DUF11 domain-containing protein [Mangrovibacterium marinum]PTN04627.1 putative repeat protein (TIGR01451 family)/predicted secreted protein (Por secretion system target) [Mangrovibacterium marinum]
MKKLYFLRNDLTQESNDKSLPTCHVRSILLVLIFLFTGSSFLWAQTVTTDKADYLPGETVTISGTNWLPGETVLLVLEKEPPVTDPVVLSAVADENGDISNSEYVVLQEDLGVTFTLTATGQSSLLTATTTFTDGGGAYTINLAAADPSNYIPAIPYPTDLTAPTGYGDGNAVIPLALFNDGSSDVKVESLAPEDMALGQIVPFEIKITVSGDITPENGIITFVVGWNTLTTNGGDFGYDARGDDVGYGVFRAFIDTGDGAYTDGSIQATVDTYTWSLINDEIIGIFTVSGLEYGDEVVVEAWLVLDDDIPAGIGGNVQSRLIVAATGPDQTINVSNSGTITLVNGDAISTGNQTVPLLKPSDFFNADVDLSVTKTDDIDPILVGETLTYEITASNAGPSVANSVVVYDVLDPNVTFVSASDGGYINTDSGDLIPDGAVQWNVGALAPGASVTYTVSVAVNNDSPATGTGGDGSSTSCITGVDLCNHVAFITISDDTNSSNDQYYEPTGVYNCPDFTLPANGESTVSCLSDATQPTPPTVNDHLGSPIVPSGPTIVDTPDPLVCSGTRVYTWTYEDCEYSHEWTYTYTVNDNLAPMFTTTPAQLELTCFDQDAIDTWLASAAASDNCGGLVTIDNNYSAPTGDCLNGTYPVKFTATDVCNNSAEVTVNIVINDDVAPVFTTTPAQLELTCFDQDAIDTWLASAAASDNCGGLVTIDNDYSAPTGDCLNGTYPVKFTATDVCNNSAEVTVNIVINDDVAPVFTTTPAQLELTCFDQDAIDTWLASAAASDNCGGLVTIDNNYSAPTGDCLNGTYPVKFTATDVCNNSAEVTVNIVINDNTPPVITCPPLAVVNCEGDTSPENTGKATATDNCDASVDITYLDATSTTPGCAATATITRTWTATDDCDNSSSCDQTILVASIDIVKTFAADNVIAGGAGSSFTLVVTNDGSAPLSNVAIYDDVDDRLTVTSISGTAGTDADTDGDAQTVEWLIPLLAPGASETITVTFQVASDVEEADGVEGRLNDEYNVPNSATVNAIATDDNTISVGDEDDDTIDIKVVIDLSIVKEFVPAEVQVPQGTFQTFTLVVSNAGPSDAVDVLVKDTVHSSLEITGVNVLDPGIGTATWDGPYLDCTVQIPAGESVTIEVEYLTAPFLDGDSPNDTGAGDDFYFVFVNGSVLEGSTDGGPVLLDGVDITDQVQIITSLTRNDLIFDPPGDDPAFEMHLSCSDPFTDGWGQSAGPVEGVDVNWQIAFFTIARFNANGYIKSCGNVTVPYDIPNTGYASGEDSYETQEVDDDANVTIIPGITLTDLTTLGKRLTARLTNKTGDDKVIEEITVVWPESNGDLVKVWLVTGNVTEVIWEGNYAWEEGGALLDSSDVSGWYGSTLLTGEAILRFDFVNKVANSGYTIRVWFEDGTWLDIHKVGDQPTPPPTTDLNCTAEVTTEIGTFKGSDGVVTVTVSGGTAPYEVCLGSDCEPDVLEGENVSFGALSAGTYTFDVTDDDGNTCNCTATLSNPKKNNKEAAVSFTVESADLQVYPNPFSEKVRFEFVSPEAAQVRIDLYDMHGRMIKTVFDEMIEGNALKVAEFVPQGKTSGAYHYRCIIGDEIFTGTLIYQK